MDGTKRWTLVSEEIRSPTSITIDFQNNNRLYYVDTKLSRIESITEKGTDRVTVLQGDNLRHPIALDVFESSLYFINRDSGDLLKQDKFGRGLSEPLERDLGNPTSVKGKDQGS
jgi:low density lipoprotein-related protein 2